MEHKVPYKKSRATGRPVTPAEGAWLRCQLILRNLTYKPIIIKSGCSQPMITHFLKGRKNSDKVKNALADVLGYESFDALLAASREKGAV